VPIRWRLTLFIALAIGAILLVLSIVLFFSLRDALLSKVEDTTKKRAENAAGTIHEGEAFDKDDIEELTLDGVFVIVRDGKGRVLTETIDIPQGGGRDPIWRRALDTGKPAWGTAHFSSEDPTYVHAVLVEPVKGPAKGRIRVVEAGKSYEAAREGVESLATILATSIGAAFILSIGGAYLLARAAMRPVEAVTSTARAMGEEDLAKRLPVANPKDEIGRLATTVNALLARLEAAFARREEALSRQRRFAADASHELRTPLTSISGHARMLDEWAIDEDPERAKRSAGAIRVAAGRMQNLIESLLVLTRGDENTGLEVGRHDLGAVAEEAAQAARTAADGRVSVEYARPKRAVEATFDRDRIFQVASILLDNAVKYSRDGGSVLVRVEEVDDGATLEVSDAGIGIPEDQLPLVFERFYRMDRSRTDGGVGLGLSIARQIAEAHGGALQATSAPGEGSTFTLHLLYRPQPRS
jgi:signal transduction histidine kinase